MGNVSASFGRRVDKSFGINADTDDGGRTAAYIGSSKE
jgi:hypothetical protein